MESYNSFKVAQQQVLESAKLLNLDQATVELLIYPQREFKFTFPVKMDNGKVKIFHGRLTYIARPKNPYNRKKHVCPSAARGIFTKALLPGVKKDFGLLHGFHRPGRKVGFPGPALHLHPHHGGIDHPRTHAHSLFQEGLLGAGYQPGVVLSYGKECGKIRQHGEAGGEFFEFLVKGRHHAQLVAVVFGAECYVEPVFAGIGLDAVHVCLRLGRAYIMTAGCGNPHTKNGEPGKDRPMIFSGLWTAGGCR